MNEQENGPQKQKAHHRNGEQNNDNTNDKKKIEISVVSPCHGGSRKASQCGMLHDCRGAGYSILA